MEVHVLEEESSKSKKEFEVAERFGWCGSEQASRLYDGQAGVFVFVVRTYVRITVERWL